METPSFELVFEGPVDNSEKTKTRILEVLNKRCGFQIVELNEALSHGPVSVKRSREKQDLEVDYQALKDAGGKVLIVKSTTEKENKKSQRTAFSAFYNKYATRLYEILMSVDVSQVEELLEDLLKARRDGRQVFLIGNGGSAATASHMANDFSKERFDDEKYLFKVMSLTDNVSWMTATANDFGYDYVFVNQLKNLLQPGALVIGISSSGNSANITKAVEFAKKKGATTYGIVGFSGGELQKCANKVIYIPTKKGQYGYHEDVTSILSHMLSIYIYEKDCDSVNSEKGHN